MSSNNGRTISFRALQAIAMTFSLSLWADDYFLSVNNADWNSSSWMRLGDPSAGKVAPSAGNVYWVVNGFTDSASETAAAGTLNNSEATFSAPLCIGAPSDSPFGSRSGTLAAKFGTWNMRFSEIRWYNGTIEEAMYYSRSYYGVLKLFNDGDDVVHRFVYNPDKKTVLACDLEAESADAVFAVSRWGGTVPTVGNLDKTGNGIFMQGDNFRYRGSFVIGSDCAYVPFRIGGEHTLGNPHVPQPAALRLPDNGAFGVLAAAGMQSRTRGIRLEGATAYLLTDTGTSTLRYGVSRAAGVSGVLVKYGLGTNILDCVYSAGDIVVRQGVLRIGGGASFPEGQKFIVEDGARLEIGYCGGLGRHTVTCEGSGTCVYPDDAHPTENGGWTWDFTPQNVTGDGFSATFANRVLTIDVARDAVASYDYSALAATGWITNIVKTGEGTWQPAVAPNYHGDFTLKEGITLVTEKGQLGAECGAVSKESAASLQLSGADVLVRGKRIVLAGAVNSSFTDSSAWEKGLLSDCVIVLSGDSSWVESKTHLAFARRSSVDVCGCHLALSPSNWGFAQLSDIAVTNSSSTAGRISIGWNRQLRIGDGTEFRGGAQNTITASSGSEANSAFIFVGRAKGDWTLKPGASNGTLTSGVRAGQASSANEYRYGYDGPLEISGYTKFNFQQKNGCLTFGGKVTGSGTIDVRGGIVNFNGTGHDFSGTVVLTNETSTVLPAAVRVGPGASLPGASARNEAGTFSFDGALPVTPSLVFAAGTALDMNGKNLTVADMDGFPTVVNPAPLTITGTWTVACADLLEGETLELGIGSLMFGPEASVRILDRTSDLKECVAATAGGGISGVPSVLGWKAASVRISGGMLRIGSRGLCISIR